MPALIKQPNGRGALLAGGMPGNKGGGRPRSHVRDDLLGTFDTSARPFLESVVRGDIVSKIRIPMAKVARHLKCQACAATGPTLVPTSPAVADFEVDIPSSATVSQRIDVAELMARYGVGQIKELTADNVRERLTKTLDSLATILSPEQYERACKEIQPHWA